MGKTLYLREENNVFLLRQWLRITNFQQIGQEITIRGATFIQLAVSFKIIIVHGKCVEKRLGGLAVAISVAERFTEMGAGFP